MAKDNNNINTDDLTAGGAASSSSSSVVKSVSNEATEAAATSNEVQTATPAPNPPLTATTTTTEVPRREENPFSFKHFLKWEGNHQNHTINGVSSASSINHSRSTSNINGHADGTGAANCGGSTVTVTTATTSASATTSAGASTSSPSKSATTSSLNVVSSTTGARPKIPQFQSVNTLSSESKMKRSPRFPSFDSQSSLSDFADERYGSIYQSRSNGSFNSDYPPGGPTGGGGLREEDSNGMERLGEQVELLRGYVQRSYSNYDSLDSPGSSSARGNEPVHNDPPGRGLVGAAEFSAALPDFVQDHLVMEQWYNTLPKGTGSGSSGSLEIDDVLDLTGVANVSGGGAPLSACNDIPFDLTSTTGQPVGLAGHRHSRVSGNPTGPELGFDLPPRSPTLSSSELPPDLTESNAGGVGEPGGGSVSGGVPGGIRTRSYYYSSSPPPSQPSGPSGSDKIHRLPDFLSDGPIHSSGRLADVTHDTPHASETAAAAAAASDRRQRIQQRQREVQYQSRLGEELMENERLRRELDASRQTVSEQSRRIRELERDLETMVSLNRAGGSGLLQQRDSGSNGSTQSNASSFLQAKTRAATAEAEMKQLRQKLSSMSVEMEALRRENETLKEEACGGAIGGSTGAGASARSRPDEGSDHGSNRSRRERSSAFLRAQTIALRQAASTAESNLRQLLSGVENLRSMANQIESFRVTQDGEKQETAASIPLEDYLHDVGINSDDDDDDEDDDEPFGPAL
uniref:Endosome-associated-trafficking regulator 1 n=1 Tax=Anopheles farauti TaxID=69004 RepID=A0A182Q3X9_9DIPT